MTEEETESLTCRKCEALRNEISQLKGKLTRLKNKLTANQQQWVDTFRTIQEQNQLLMVNTGKAPKVRESHLF